MKYKILVLFLVIFINIWAVHNFTINAQENVEISLGDTLEVYFEFEEIGAEANVELQISLASLPIPAFNLEQAILADGGALDTTGVDGIFSGSLPVFASAPSAAQVNLTLTDNEVSDTVELSFTPLDSDFSLSGSIMMQGDWIDLPASGTLAYTLYNAEIYEIAELLELADIQEILDFFSENHYLVSEIADLFGQYQIFIPDTIAEVTCTTGVYGLVDMQNTHIAPDFREDVINGHGNGIDFYYSTADGIFTAEILDPDQLPVENAIISILTAGETIPQILTTDETGIITAALANGDYTITVITMQYQQHVEDFSINDSDISLTINLINLTSAPIDNISNPKLLHCYPNPIYLNSENHVTIAYQLPNSSQQNCMIKIYNIKGQCVNTLQASSSADLKQIIWDGNGANGTTLANGIYYLQLSTNKKTLDTKKIMILK